MSRIGNKPIALPAGVSVQIAADNTVTVKGPKGTLSQKIDPDISVKVEEGKILVQRPTDQKRHKALHGLYRALLNNMVIGVSQGFKKQLELIGVGYKAEAKGQLLQLSLGYSHGIVFAVPNEVKVTAETPKGKAPLITLEHRQAIARADCS